MDERLTESIDFTWIDAILRRILNKNNRCNYIIIMVIFWWVRQRLDFRGICENKRVILDDFKLSENLFLLGFSVFYRSDYRSEFGVIWWIVWKFDTILKLACELNTSPPWGKDCRFWKCKYTRDGKTYCNSIGLLHIFLV